MVGAKARKGATHRAARPLQLSPTQFRASPTEPASVASSHRQVRRAPPIAAVKNDLAPAPTSPPAPHSLRADSLVVTMAFATRYRAANTATTVANLSAFFSFASGALAPAAAAY